jgi:phospholipid transport system substrate-binding protein
MIKYVKSVLVLCGVVGLTISMSARAKTTAPMPVVSIASSATANTVIKDFYVQLVDTMKQGGQLGFSGRYKKLEPAMKKAFNLPLMARFSVGSNWDKATSAEQQQLASAFSDFSVATYASQFKNWDGELFEVTGQKPSTDAGVIVETKLKPKDGEAVALNYLMRADEKGQWRIVDVFLDGAISQLATRRAEFSSIVRRDGIDALVNSLGDKTKQLGPT